MSIRMAGGNNGNICIAYESENNRFNAYRKEGYTFYFVYFNNKEIYPDSIKNLSPEIIEKLEKNPMGKYFMVIEITKRGTFRYNIRVPNEDVE